MIGVFRESGFPVHVHASPDGIEIEFPTELGEDARARFQDRDRVAAVAAVGRILRPRSVAELYPVNPNAYFVGSRKAVASVSATGGPVDLAIIAVPAEQVPKVARECGEAGVAGLVVITAGFSEAGPEGAAR